MAQFQIPQFIDKKAKIIGPLTLSQFLYIAGAGGLSVLAFYTLPPLFSFLILIFAGGLGISLAFIKINGQPLPKVILHAITFWQKPKKYVWKKDIETTTLDTSSVEKIKAVRKNMGLQGKIKSAVRNITTGNIPFFKKDNKKEQQERYQTVRHLTGEVEKAKRVDYSE